jgi:D-alanyl-lipoteichoic acid acyltransferase DltB (MBOAT superfamily)
VFNALAISIKLPNFKILLPIGVSFYTLQVIGYIIDVYRGNTQPCKHFGKYALFVSFFPKIAQGPIDRADNLLIQLNEEHPFNFNKARSSFLLILIGLFKKVVVSDRLAVIVNTIFSNAASLNGIPLWIGSIFYSIQLYCDFSGYTDIARGSAALMGFNLPNNFRQPYLSRSIAESWRRWHMSLSFWIRDYIYFPLGGSRVSKARWALNILTVFLISGLWHGANFTFVLWGILHGIYQVIGKFTAPTRNIIKERLKLNTDHWLSHMFSVFFTFLLVNIAWVFFRAESITAALDFIRRMLNLTGDLQLSAFGADINEFILSLFLIVIIFGMDLLQEKYDSIQLIENRSVLIRWPVYLILLLTIIMFGVYGDLSESSFMYMGF